MWRKSVRERERKKGNVYVRERKQEIVRVSEREREREREREKEAEWLIRKQSEGDERSWKWLALKLAKINFCENKMFWSVIRQTTKTFPQVEREWEAVWPDLAKFCYIGIILKSFQLFLELLFSIGQICELTLANIWYFWANFYCSKWPNIEIIR